MASIRSTSPIFPYGPSKGGSSAGTSPFTSPITSKYAGDWTKPTGNPRYPTPPAPSVTQPPPMTYAPPSGTATAKAASYRPSTAVSGYDGPWGGARNPDGSLAIQGGWFPKGANQPQAMAPSVATPPGDIVGGATPGDGGGGGGGTGTGGGGTGGGGLSLAMAGLAGAAEEPAVSFLVAPRSVRQGIGNRIVPNVERVLAGLQRAY